MIVTQMINNLFLKKRLIGIFLLIPILVLCAPKKILDPDPNLSRDASGLVLLYQNKPFTGILVVNLGTGNRREIEFLNGKQDGSMKEFYEDGKLAAHYIYKQGEKVGTHKGWYENGNLRFHYEYDENGNQHGDIWEWTENGKVYLYKKVEHGKEIGQKIWRADGKIYANYLYKETGLLGLTGGKLCRTVKGEDGKTRSY